MDVWKRKGQDSEALLALANKRLMELIERKSLLVEALLYKPIAQHIYDENIDKVEQDIALAEMASQDAKLEQLDVEAILAFAENLLGNTARLWMDSPVEQKRQLQQVLFPARIEYSAISGFGTAGCSSIFNTLPEFTTAETSLASPTGFEPVLSP